MLHGLSMEMGDLRNSRQPRQSRRRDVRIVISLIKLH
jgi:hypothetical protein